MSNSKLQRSLRELSHTGVGKIPFDLRRFIVDTLQQKMGAYQSACGMSACEIAKNKGDLYHLGLEDDKQSKPHIVRHRLADARKCAMLLEELVGFDKCLLLTSSFLAVGSLVMTEMKVQHGFVTFSRRASTLMAGFTAAYVAGDLLVVQSALQKIANDRCRGA